MSSGGLGLVNSAVNSLLGSASANLTGKAVTDNSFNQVFDKKMECSAKDKGKNHNVLKPKQVNRDETAAKNIKNPKKTETYVKADMQKNKKNIEQVTKEKESKEKVPAMSENKKVSKEKITNDTEVNEELVAEVAKEVDDKSVLKELMDLLANDQLSEKEKTDSINIMLGNLTETDLTELKSESAMLKSMLLSLNGSLKEFETVLSNLEKIDVEDSENAENIIVKQVQEISDSQKILSDENVMKTSAKETETVENLPINKVLTKEKNEELGKEEKVEKLENSSQKNERIVMGSGISSDTNTNKNMNQHSAMDSSQSFAESLKFHTATAKTVAMKNVVTNPFGEKIMQQIIKGTQVSMNVGKDVSEMMIKLNPKELGNVSLKISFRNDELIAEFNVENKTVKEVLESRLDDLKTALSDKGFNIQGLDVSVNQDANDQFKSYEEFIKEQKGKKKFDSLESIEGIVGLDEANTKNQWQTLETTSSEINVLA